MFAFVLQDSGVMELIQPVNLVNISFVKIVKTLLSRPAYADGEIQLEVSM